MAENLLQSGEAPAALQIAASKGVAQLVDVEPFNVAPTSQYRVNEARRFAIPR
jgi:hypothetical protein